MSFSVLFSSRKLRHVRGVTLMRNKLLLSLVIATFFCGLLGASPVSALAVHHPAAPPRSPVGGGCYGQYANASPLYFQSCISINGSKQVAPDGYVQSTTSSNGNKWGDCEVEVIMYVSSDGKNWLQDTSTPRQATKRPAIPCLGHECPCTDDS